MILFVWSLVANAINGARRSRLAKLVLQHLEGEKREEWALILRERSSGGGLSRYSSAPSLLADDNVLYRGEGVELSLNQKVRLAKVGWTVNAVDAPLDFLRASSKSASSAILGTLGVLPRAEDVPTPVFFVATMRRKPPTPRDYNNAAVGLIPAFLVSGYAFEIEEESIALAWRQEALLEVLFVSQTGDKFADAACAWAEASLAYHNDFLVQAIEMEVEEGFLAQILAKSSNKPVCVAVLERLCLDDICAAKALPQLLNPLASALLRRSGSLLNSHSGRTSRASTDLSDSLPLSEAGTSQGSLSLAVPLTLSIPSAEEQLQACLTLAPPAGGDKQGIEVGAHSLPNGSVVEKEEDSFDALSLDSPVSAYGSYSLQREQRRSHLKSESAEAMTEVVHIPGTRRMSLLVTGNAGLSSSYAASSEAGRMRSYDRYTRRQSLMPASALRNRRRSMSPMFEGDTDSSPHLLPSAAEGVRGWQRATSFRSSSTGAGRRRASSIGNLLGLKAPKSPPNIVIYAGDKAASPTVLQLRQLVERSVRSNSHAVHILTHEQLLRDPWKENTACLMVVDTDTLDESGWSRIEDYFRKGNGKVLFVCQNRLLASLTDADSNKKRQDLLKLAFLPQKNARGAPHSLGKDFQSFMKKVSKALKKPQVSESFNAKDLVGGYRYAISVVRKEGTPLILYMQTGGGKDTAGALFSDATLDNLLEEDSNLIREGLERLQLPISPRKGSLNLTPAFLFTRANKTEIMAKICESLGSLEGPLPVDFLTPETHNSNSETTSLGGGRLPVWSREGDSALDTDTYFARLRTGNRFGQNVLFVPVIGSTMDAMHTLVNASTKFDDFVVIAENQVSGKGRGGNRWLSPEGCAMFSAPLRIPLSSRLGKAPGFIQHLLALSVVEAINILLKDIEFPLGIKWPNDLYYLKLHKLGGVLVNCSVFADEIRCVMGCGLNVANSVPTVCINDLAGASLQVEDVIAEILNNLEALVAQFQEGGDARILPLYHRHWLHGREEVVVQATGEKVVIRGLDPHGYLEVRSKSTGRLLSLQPDGNSFDMMKGLIKMKE